MINVKDLYKSPNLCCERYSSKHQHLTFSTFTYEDHLTRKQADMFPSELSLHCLSHMMAKPRSTAQACIFSLNRWRGWKESREYWWKNTAHGAASDSGSSEKIKAPICLSRSLISKWVHLGCFLAGLGVLAAQIKLMIFCADIFQNSIAFLLVTWISDKI